jgi:hypothetical protein
MRIVGDPDAYPARVPARPGEDDVMSLLVNDDQSNEQERENPSGGGMLSDMVGSEVLAFIGYADAVWTTEARRVNRYVMFTPPVMDRLVLVPDEDVERTDVPDDNGVESAFSDWHQFAPKGQGFKFEIPDEEPIALGAAERIEYSSDKMVRPDDEGEWHDYYHDFDAGAHPVVQVGEVIIIAPSGSLEINTQGKLGIVN